MKFNPLFFEKINKNWKNGRNRTLLDCLKNQYNKNETWNVKILILQAIQESSISTIFSFFVNFFKK